MSLLSIGRQFAKPSQTLAEIGIFQYCSPSTLGLLETLVRIKNVPRGHLLFLQGDEAEYFYMIDSGLVKIFRETMDGKKVIFDTIPGGNILGETITINNRRHEYSADAVTTTSLKLYPLSLLHLELKNNSSFNEAMQNHITHLNFLKDMEIEHRTLHSASQKICCFILRLCAVKREGIVMQKLPYDKSLIALRLGMEPETFSRALARLKNDTGIELVGDIVEIPDMSRLIHYSCMTCSLRYPCGT